MLFDQDVTDDEAFKDADLIIACDGLNSRIRTKYEQSYKPNIDVRKCRFVWLGTTKLFEAFTFAFEKTHHGWYQAHCYQFDSELSTFIVETTEETWLQEGLDKFSKEESIAFCEKLFAQHLEGHALLSNAEHLRGSSQWIKFPRIICENWVHQRFQMRTSCRHSPISRSLPRVASRPHYQRRAARWQSLLGRHLQALKLSLVRLHLSQQPRQLVSLFRLGRDCSTPTARRIFFWVPVLATLARLAVGRMSVSGESALAR